MVEGVRPSSSSQNFMSECQLPCFCFSFSCLYLGKQKTLVQYSGPGTPVRDKERYSGSQCWPEKYLDNAAISKLEDGRFLFSLALCLSSIPVSLCLCVCARTCVCMCFLLRICYSVITLF